MTIPTRTALSKIAMLAVLAVCAGFGCRKAPEPSSEANPGDKWLKMSIADRTQAVASFIDGYNLGAFQACGLLANAFEAHPNKQMNEEEIRSNLTDMQLCQQKAGAYSQVKRDTSSSDAYVAYVNVITTFYQKYPSQRDVPPFLLLMNMQDGFDSTVEQLHDSAGKSILRHH